jgi:hypothetical protein
MPAFYMQHQILALRCLSLYHRRPGAFTLRLSTGGRRDVRNLTDVIVAQNEEGVSANRS